MNLSYGKGGGSCDSGGCEEDARAGVCYVYIDAESEAWGRGGCEGDAGAGCLTSVWVQWGRWLELPVRGSFLVLSLVLSDPAYLDDLPAETRRENLTRWLMA